MSGNPLVSAPAAMPPAPAALIAPSYEQRFIELAAGVASGKIALPPKDGNKKSGRIMWLDWWNGTDRLYELVNGVAIIPVSGVLLQEFPVVGWEYATGYDGLRLQIHQALSDGEVKAIVLWVSSGGGDVAGCFDLVDWFAAAKATAKKPVVAILNEVAYSAAYAIASVADAITVPRTGGVGSVGVVMLHADYSKMFEDWGVKLTFIYAGKHKVDGNPFSELPDDVKATWQVECEEIRQLFAATVARNRTAAGVSLDVKDVMATEAAIYSSPSALAAAIKIGLADEIMAPLDALQRVIDQAAA